MPSYGVAIALLTVTVRIFLIPLTTKQVKSQQAMQRIQPELKRLQAKHKNDRQKLNEEMMKFYKENKVNPLAGCLPILLQAPLFIVLYRLILDLSKDGPSTIPTAASCTSPGGVGRQDRVWGSTCPRPRPRSSAPALLRGGGHRRHRLLPAAADDGAGCPRTASTPRCR